MELTEGQIVDGAFAASMTNPIRSSRPGKMGSSCTQFQLRTRCTNVVCRTHRMDIHMYLTQKLCIFGQNLETCGLRTLFYLEGVS